LPPLPSTMQRSKHHPLLSTALSPHKIPQRLTEFIDAPAWPYSEKVYTIRRRTTQKITHDIQNTAKAWNQELNFCSWNKTAYTYSLEQSPSWEAKQLAASQKTLRILRHSQLPTTCPY
jgi:hypothetical protein